MKSLQIVGALLIVVGLVMLFFLRGPLISLILFVLEFVAIIIALIFVAVGIGLLFGGRWVRRRTFWS